MNILQKRFDELVASGDPAVSGIGSWSWGVVFEINDGLSPVRPFSQCEGSNDLGGSLGAVNCAARTVPSAQAKA